MCKKVSSAARAKARAWQREFILIERSVDYEGWGEYQSVGWNECPCRPEGGHAGIAWPIRLWLSAHCVRLYRAARSIPGLAVVYAPHLLALGLLARLLPNRSQIFIIAAGILVLLFYSLYCDPLWTMVSGVAWIVPFGVVTFGPLRRDTILVRSAVLGGCVAVLLLSGALEYVYSLSQYTARVQFPDLLQRARSLETTSVFSCPSTQNISTGHVRPVGRSAFGGCVADHEFSQ
jgi:hypothetical protein